MRTSKFLAGLATLLLLAAPLSAQDSTKDTEKARREAEAQMRNAEKQVREAERAMREAAERLARFHTDTDKRIRKLDRKVVIFGERARLGVVLQSEKNPKTDAIGAYVEGLTPGSPAEEAGLQPGDIIVRFNGEPLANAKVEADEDESVPTARLMELAHNLKDGDTVSLEYRRGDQTRTVAVKATRALGPHIKMVTVPERIEIPEIEIPDVGDIDVDVSALGRPWHDMDMVALNPELGEYFGTAEGILVVHTAKESPLKLKSGDIILKIGDRTPTTPAQTMRILRSYEPGETMALQVMRKREKLTVSVQAPPHRTGAMQWHSPAPEPPEPPAPPVAPAPPTPRL
jgi:C-terminal processing protease CtpA/Prc